MVLSGAITLLVEKSVLGVGLPFCQLSVREALSPTSHKSYCHCYWLHARTGTMLMTPLPLPQTWRNQTRTVMEVLSLLAYCWSTGRYYVAVRRWLGANCHWQCCWVMEPVTYTSNMSAKMCWLVQDCILQLSWVQPTALWLDLRPSAREGTCICYYSLRQRHMR